MIQFKITGDKPFQIAAESFAISPSTDGYTLNFSADGKQYTAWTEATPANENTVVNGAAKGMYYQLSGNKGEVTITY